MGCGSGFFFFLAFTLGCPGSPADTRGRGSREVPGMGPKWTVRGKGAHGDPPLRGRPKVYKKKRKRKPTKKRPGWLMDKKGDSFVDIRLVLWLKGQRGGGDMDDIKKRDTGQPEAGTKSRVNTKRTLARVSEQRPHGKRKFICR